MKLRIIIITLFLGLIAGSLIAWPVAGEIVNHPGAMWQWNGSTWQPYGHAGFLGSATLSIPLSTSVALPTAPAGALNCLIFPTQDVNFGNTSVASGTDWPYLFQLVPGQGFFNCTSFTGYRLVGRTAVATATILWY